MKNDSFLMSLPDTIQKSRVIEESRVVRKELADSTLPVFESAKNVFEKGSLKNPQTKKIQDLYERLSHRKSSIIDDIALALPIIDDNLKNLEDYVNRSFNKEIMKESISLKELSVLQFIGIAQFVSSFSRYLLSYFYTAESSSFENSSIALKDVFSKADIAYIERNMLDYINALGSLSVKTSDLNRLLNSIPELHVNPENVRSVMAVQQNTKVDPFKLQFLNVTNNFVYRIMASIAEHQADAYKVALDEKRMLEYRNLLLQRQREGKSDARLEKEITIIENRIAKLNYKIRQMEEANG